MNPSEVKALLLQARAREEVGYPPSPEFKFLEEWGRGLIRED